VVYDPSSTGDPIVDGASGSSAPARGRSLRPWSKLSGRTCGPRCTFAGCRGGPPRRGEQGARYLPRAPLTGRESRARGALAHPGHARAGATDHAGLQDGGGRLVVARPQFRAQDRRPEGVRPDPQGAPGEGEGGLGGRRGVRGSVPGDRGHHGRDRCLHDGGHDQLGNDLIGIHTDRVPRPRPASRPGLRRGLVGSSCTHPWRRGDREDLTTAHSGG